MTTEQSGISATALEIEVRDHILNDVAKKFRGVVNFQATGLSPIEEGVNTFHFRFPPSIPQSSMVEAIGEIVFVDARDQLVRNGEEQDGRFKETIKDCIPLRFYDRDKVSHFPVFIEPFVEILSGPSIGNCVNPEWLNAPNEVEVSALGVADYQFDVSATYADKSEDGMRVSIKRRVRVSQAFWTAFERPREQLLDEAP